MDILLLAKHRDLRFFPPRSTHVRTVVTRAKLLIVRQLPHLPTSSQAGDASFGNMRAPAARRRQLTCWLRCRYRACE